MQSNKKYSFHIHGFWHHVEMSGNIGVDQLGNRWIKRGDFLYSEFSCRIIDLNSKEVMK